MAREREENEAKALIEGDPEIKRLYGMYSSGMAEIGVASNPKDFLESSTYKVFESFRKAGTPYPFEAYDQANEQAKFTDTEIFQALDAAKLDTKEERQAFLDKYLPGKTQEELIKMSDDYNGPYQTPKALKNLDAVISEAPVVTQVEKAQIREAEKNPLGRALQSQYDTKNTAAAVAPKAPSFLERVKIDIQVASKNIQEAAQRATAKIDQRVAAAAEKKEIKQAVKEWQGKPSLLERIKSAATNAKTQIAGIASDAITKLQAIGKKAESQAVEMDEMKVSAPDVSTFKKVTENNAAQLAANTVLNPHQGANAEEVQAPAVSAPVAEAVQAPPKEVEKGQEKVAEHDDLELSPEDREWLDNADEDQFEAEHAEAKAAMADPDMAQVLASVEAVEVQANNDIQEGEQGFTMQMDLSWLDEKVEASESHEAGKSEAVVAAPPAVEKEDWMKALEAMTNEVNDKLDPKEAESKQDKAPEPPSPRGPGSSH